IGDGECAFHDAAPNAQVRTLRGKEVAREDAHPIHVAGRGHAGPPKRFPKGSANASTVSAPEKECEIHAPGPRKSGRVPAPCRSVVVTKTQNERCAAVRK